MKLNIASISCFIFISIVSYYGTGADAITPYEMNMKKLTNSLFRKTNADRITFPRFMSRRLSASTCCIEKKWNPVYVGSESMYLSGHQDFCFNGTFRDCSDQFRSQHNELCANVAPSEDYHSMSEIQRKCEHFARGDCATDDRNIYATFSGTPEMCAEVSAQAQGGAPICETKQDCLDTLPPELGILKDSVVCGNGAAYGVTHKSCFQVCDMQADGTHTVQMKDATSNADCSLFAARVGWDFPVVCSNFKDSGFQENVCIPNAQPPSYQDPSSCSSHGLSDLYNKTLPSGEPCPEGCTCCKADGSCGECDSNYVCGDSGDGFKKCTSCDVKFSGNQSAIDMCYAGAGQGFMAADGFHYDNSCGGSSPPSHSPNWDKCFADKKLEECPEAATMTTNLTTLPGFDGEKWVADEAWTLSWLNQQTAAKEFITCYCKCSDEIDEVWPIGKTVCQSLTPWYSGPSGPSNGDCSGDTCCGAGTIYKYGKCVASYEDMQNACKSGGNEGWKCISFSDNYCD